LREREGTRVMQLQLHQSSPAWLLQYLYSVGHVCRGSVSGSIFIAVEQPLVPLAIESVRIDQRYKRALVSRSFAGNC
jgi:hypothetical protein